MLLPTPHLKSNALIFCLIGLQHVLNDLRRSTTPSVNKLASI